MAATLLYLNTAPCEDCGIAIDYLHEPWYPLYPDGALCHCCGEARGLTGIMPPQNDKGDTPMTSTPEGQPMTQLTFDDARSAGEADGHHDRPLPPGPDADTGPPCEHEPCWDSLADTCLYRAAGNLTGKEDWPRPAKAKGRKYPPLPGDARLAAWVRRYADEGTGYLYESLACDLCRRWDWATAAALADGIRNAAEGWGTGDADAWRLYQLLGWRQAALFAAWFKDRGNYGLAREMGWRQADPFEIEQDKAIAWLRPRLESGSVPQDDLEAAAKLAGIRLLSFAAQTLGVIATSDDGEQWRIHPGVAHENCYQNDHGRRARWTWSLPVRPAALKAGRP